MKSYQNYFDFLHNKSDMCLTEQTRSLILQYSCYARTKVFYDYIELYTDSNLECKQTLSLYSIRNKFNSTTLGIYIIDFLHIL